LFIGWEKAEKGLFTPIILFEIGNFFKNKMNI
jgi:hypothetical protein